MACFCLLINLGDPRAENGDRTNISGEKSVRQDDMAGRKAPEEDQTDQTSSKKRFAFPASDWPQNVWRA